MTLVRSLVRRKSYVAIDAHHAFLRRPHVRGSEVYHGAVHGFDQRQHRLLELTLELRLVGLEPLPPVISPQAPQKSEPGFTEVGFPGFPVGVGGAG
jgi:hypothetical protein